MRRLGKALTLAVLALAAARAGRCDMAGAADTATLPTPELWGVHFQATTIPQGDLPVHSPYQGPLSLVGAAQLRTSLTGTIFAGARLWQGAELYVNPEMAGGRGLSGVNGIAGSPNGEMPRVGNPDETLYLGRLFLRHNFALGTAVESVAPDQNQLAGMRPTDRITVTAGNFSAEDLFDNNAYAHDPRGQFMNWTLMANGAWDYPADTRGYTWGGAVEASRGAWTARAGLFLMPTYANGPDFDTKYMTEDHGVVSELERRQDFDGLKGAVRVLGYINTAKMGDYSEALAEMPVDPSVISTRQVGRIKYGFGLSADQQLAPDVGAFLRLGWDDGHTESFAFTPIDRTASVGLSVQGRRWGRPDDTFAIATVVNGLSQIHREYLAAGGLDFDLGDGALSYSPEWILETYYLYKLPLGFELTLDFQGIQNPGYNRDRGPAAIGSVRLHYQI
jgi:high affinity Mn2+ porin